jgi:nucleosome assembly protein 1-like 1
LLLRLQQKHKKLMIQYQEEELKLKQKFLAKSNPLFEERCKIINTGNVEDPPSYQWAQGRSQGIPGFWLRAMENHPKISTYVKSHDTELLYHLLDIQLEYLTGNSIGFSLIFKFSKNQFIKNTTIRKTYTYNRPIVSDESITEAYGHDFTYGDMKSDGVNWKKGMNLAVKQGKNGKDQAEETFFTFFSEPTEALLLSLAEKDEEAEFGKEELNDLYEWLVNEHYELGEVFKEDLIPNGVHWYTGEAAMYDFDSDEAD